MLAILALDRPATGARQSPVEHTPSSQLTQALLGARTRHGATTREASLGLISASRGTGVDMSVSAQLKINIDGALDDGSSARRPSAPEAASA